MANEVEILIKATASGSGATEQAAQLDKVAASAQGAANAITPAYWVAGTLISGTNTYTGRLPFYQ